MRLSAALAVAGVLWAVSPQNPPPAPTPPPQQAPPIFRAGVDAVQFEVSVLDKNRRPVHGLTKADFAVLEDGKPQTIIDAREISMDDEPPPPVWARAVPIDTATNDLVDRRLIAIVMDDLRCCAAGGGNVSDRWAINNALTTAQRIVDSLGVHDLAAVALTHDAIPIQRFTDNRDELSREIARFKPITEGGCLPMVPSYMLYDLQTLMAMSPQPTKAIIHITSTAPLDYRTIPRCPPPSYRIPDTGRVVTRTTPAAGGAMLDPIGLPRVPIYTLNVSGLAVAPPTIGRGQRATFPPMSGPNGSGGQAFYDTNDLGSAVEQIFAENNSYYLIGFNTSRPTSDGKFRRIEVKIPEHSEYTIRTRSGYMRPKPPPKPGSREARNPEVPRAPASVKNMLPSSDITMTTAVAAFAQPGGRVALLTTVDLTHAVTELPLTGMEDLELRTVAYASGDPKYDVRAKTAVPVPPGVSRVSTTFRSRLDVAPDKYELWLTAHDGRTDRIGGVFYNLEIPDFAARAITISGVVMGRDPTEAVPLPAAFAGVVPIVPSTSRTFGQDDAISAFFQVYQGRETALAPVALTIKVLDDKGVTKFEVTEALAPGKFSSNRGSDYRLKLPLDTLTTGRYLLTIEAKLGERISPRRDVPFSVR